MESPCRNLLHCKVFGFQCPRQNPPQCGVCRFVSVGNTMQRGAFYQRPGGGLHGLTGYSATQRVHHPPHQDAQSRGCGSRPSAALRHCVDGRARPNDIARLEDKGRIPRNAGGRRRNTPHCVTRPSSAWCGVASCKSPNPMSLPPPPRTHTHTQPRRSPGAGSN